MFGFLKDKLKGALGKLTKEVEKEATVEKKEVMVETKSLPVEKKDDKKFQDVKTERSKETKKTEEKIEVPTIPEPKKRGFFQKIFGKKEEEELIEEKEELRERAERNIIEPVQKTKSINTEKIEKKIDIKEPVSKPIITKEIKPVIKETEIKEYKKIEVKESISKPTTKQEITPEVATKTETVKIETKKVENIKNIEPIVSKPQPHYQVIEEERSKKVIEQKEEEHERKGFFTKITETFTKIQISDEKFEELFWDLEVVLLENNVAVEVIDKIKRDLKKELMNGKVSRKGVDELILSTLRQSISELFDVEKIDLIKNIKEKRKNNQPYIVAVIGVNGSGKTTSIAKLTHKFQKEGLSVVLAASDTFRAAAIQQLEEHANKLNVKIVKHDYNSDPAAVAFDAIKYAEAKNIDVVIIDTAGRLHSNTNLMRELEKVIRVCKPDIKIFVGESITGNDCVEQAKEFDKAVGIDAIILAKADVDDKGGAAISVSYILQRPILYLGTGQTYDDLKEFDSKLILESLEL